MIANTETIRDLIAQECGMINNRMNWFLVLQGFMLAGIAFGWEKSIALCIIFSSIGILSSISVGILLRCGILTIKHLEGLNNENTDLVIGRRYKDTPGIIHFLLPWHFLPIVFILAWISMIIIRLLKT